MKVRIFVLRSRALLTVFSIDGRVSLSLIGTSGSQEVELTYQLLNPAPHFREVVDVARSVILAGGTMSPVCRTGLLDVGDKLIIAIFIRFPMSLISYFHIFHQKDFAIFRVGTSFHHQIFKLWW
jgi:hypothetical protein